MTVLSAPVDRYAVIGHPVSHSRSPWIHTRFAELTGQALVYTAIDSPEDDFAGTLQRMRQDGFAGANVTVPFKLEAFTLADRRSTRATLAGAANTLIWQRHGDQLQLHADNTDGIGLMRDIVHNAGVPLTGQHILLLGAGGASAGVLGVLLAERPASITIANRSIDKAEALAASHADWAAQHGSTLQAIRLEQVLADAALPQAFDVVINGTSSSLSGQPLQLAARHLAPHALVYDMMYGPAARPFLQHAASLGAQTRDGLGMLVEQAAEAFRLWRGVRPATAPLLSALRQEVDAA